MTLSDLDSMYRHIQEGLASDDGYEYINATKMQEDLALKFLKLLPEFIELARSANTHEYTIHNQMPPVVAREINGATDALLTKLGEMENV